MEGLGNTALNGVAVGVSLGAPTYDRDSGCGTERELNAGRVIGNFCKSEIRFLLRKKHIADAERGQGGVKGRSGITRCDRDLALIPFALDASAVPRLPLGAWKYPRPIWLFAVTQPPQKSATRHRTRWGGEV